MLIMLHLIKSLMNVAMGDLGSLVSPLMSIIISVFFEH